MDKLARLRELAAAAEPMVPAVVQRQQQRFLERWAEALAASGAAQSFSADSMHERALNEATAYAIRIDVAEELARLRAHLDEIERLLQGRRRSRQAPGLPDPGTAARGQHAGLEVGRAGADQRLGGDEGADRADARAGAEHRVGFQAVPGDPPESANLLTCKVFLSQAVPERCSEARALCGVYCGVCGVRDAFSRVSRSRTPQPLWSLWT